MGAFLKSVNGAGLVSWTLLNTIVLSQAIPLNHFVGSDADTHACSTSICFQLLTIVADDLAVPSKTVPVYEPSKS